MHKGPKCITQIPLGPSEKKVPIVQKHKEGAICAILREKTPFLAFPKAKKGVWHCAEAAQGVVALSKAVQGCALAQ